MTLELAALGEMMMEILLLSLVSIGGTVTAATPMPHFCSSTGKQAAKSHCVMDERRDVDAN
jgi:hypothetical protein